MFGYCEIGSWIMQTAPTSVITIAITIATIGRRMKKRDIGLAAWLVGTARCAVREMRSGVEKSRTPQRGVPAKADGCGCRHDCCLTSRRRRRRRRRPRLRVHHRAFPRFLDAFDDDPV